MHPQAICPHSLAWALSKPSHRGDETKDEGNTNAFDELSDRNTDEPLHFAVDQSSSADLDIVRAASEFAAKLQMLRQYFAGLLMMPSSIARDGLCTQVTSL